MYKYKMIIADDEEIISNSLCQMITNECPYIEITGVYNNGEEVIEKLKHTAVDILITDIRMPAKSGLEAARFIYEQKLKTEVIIITGFREFEYAQKAIEYGVHHLITKPIDIDKMITAIEKIKNKFEDEISVLFRENEKEQGIRQVYRSALLLLLNSNTPIETVMQNNRNFMEMGMKEDCCFVIDFNSCPEENSENETAVSTIWRDMCEIKNEEIDAYCISERKNSARFFVIVQSDDKQKMQNIIISFAEASSNLMKSAYNFDVSYSVHDLNSVRLKEPYNFNEISHTYVNYLLFGQQAKKQDFLWLIKNIADLEMLRNFTKAVLKNAEKAFYCDISDDLKSLEAMTDEASILSLLAAFETKIQKSNNEKSAIISKVKNYIQNYTGTDYSLQSIADAAAYTPYYLSRIFKNETGENLSDYIMKARINRAKELLLKKEHHILTVAQMVGFDNASYFSRVFKEHTGIMPKQYMLFGERK